jgi:hypothetical protein
MGPTCLPCALWLVLDSVDASAQIAVQLEERTHFVAVGGLIVVDPAQNSHGHTEIIAQRARVVAPKECARPSQDRRYRKCRSHRLLFDQ